MIPLRWKEVEALSLGELRGPPADGVVRRVHDDSRDARAGDLFVALNTGTQFVDEALARGAATLVPRDQEAALASLAQLVRGRSDAQVVAVVGSTGKTTTKDALAALCLAVTPTVAADASRNNELGLPLTVLRLEPETRVLVTEMGMRGLGQVAELCGIARPTLALVTSIGPEHLELVGTIENVARANAEALEALPDGGVAVVPVDEPLLEPYLRPGARRAEVRHEPRASATARPGCTRSAGDELRLELPFSQRHLAENVLAALTAYDALGLPLDRAAGRRDADRPQRVARGGAPARRRRGRGERRLQRKPDLDARVARGSRGARRRAGGAWRSWARWPSSAPRATAITPRSARSSRSSGSSWSWVSASRRAPTWRGPTGTSSEDAASVDRIVAGLRPGDAILVKASRSVGLEGIPALIEKHARAW